MCGNAAETGTCFGRRPTAGRWDDAEAHWRRGVRVRVCGKENARRNPARTICRPSRLRPFGRQRTERQYTSHNQHQPVRIRAFYPEPGLAFCLPVPSGCSSPSDWDGSSAGGTGQVLPSKGELASLGNIGKFLASQRCNKPPVGNADLGMPDLLRKSAAGLSHCVPWAVA